MNVRSLGLVLGVLLLGQSLWFYQTSRQNSAAKTSLYTLWLAHHDATANVSSAKAFLVEEDPNYLRQYAAQINETMIQTPLGIEGYFGEDLGARVFYRRLLQAVVACIRLGPTAESKQAVEEIVETVEDVQRRLHWRTGSRPWPLDPTVTDRQYVQETFASAIARLERILQRLS